MIFKETTINKNIIHSGRILTFRSDDAIAPDGSLCNREFILHPGGVGVLPVYGNGDIVLIKQWRYPIETESLEIPAGKLDPNETPLECGNRELEEETGLTANDMIPLSFIWTSPGISNERIYLFMARCLREGQKHPDEGEFVESVRMPLSDAIEMVMSGEINDSKTVCALFKARELLNK